MVKFQKDLVVRLTHTKSGKLSRIVEIYISSVLDNLDYNAHIMYV